VPRQAFRRPLQSVLVGLLAASLAFDTARAGRCGAVVRSLRCGQPRTSCGGPCTVIVVRGCDPRSGVATGGPCSRVQPCEPCAAAAGIVVEPAEVGSGARGAEIAATEVPGVQPDGHPVTPTPSETEPSNGLPAVPPAAAPAAAASSTMRPQESPITPAAEPKPPVPTNEPLPQLKPVEPAVPQPVPPAPTDGVKNPEPEKKPEPKPAEPKPAPEPNAEPKPAEPKPAPEPNAKPAEPKPAEPKPAPEPPPPPAKPREKNIFDEEENEGEVSAPAAEPGAAPPVPADSENVEPEGPAAENQGNAQTAATEPGPAVPPAAAAESEPDPEPADEPPAVPTEPAEQPGSADGSNPEPGDDFEPEPAVEEARAAGEIASAAGENAEPEAASDGDPAGGTADSRPAAEMDGTGDLDPVADGPRSPAEIEPPVATGAGDGAVSGRESESLPPPKAVAVGRPAVPPLRRWLDDTALHATVGRFIAFRDGQVDIREPSGRIVRVPLERLSGPDQDYVRQAGGEPPVPETSDTAGL